jgi:hypothetical protein
VKSVQKALKSLPKTLDETYERILLAIDEEYQRVALEALRWLCFSTKVLDINELAEAAVFSAVVQEPSKEAPFEVSFDPSERIADPLDILGILSGLVVIRFPVRKDSPEKPDDSSVSELDLFEDGDDCEERPINVTRTSKILLAHFSIKEYLVSGRLKSQVQEFAIDESRADQLLATNCLYYAFYSQSFFKDGMQIYQGWQKHPVPPKQVYDGSYPLLHYAWYRWLRHARRVKYESELDKMIISLFNADLQLQRCLLFENLERVEHNWSHTLTPLYILSELGLYRACKKLVESQPNMNTREGHYGTALQVASRQGHESIARLLLDNGANSNIEGGYYGTAIRAASYHGRGSIVQILLDHRADVNAQGGDGEVYGTALQAASTQGHKNVVQILLNHGADVNKGGGVEYSTSIHAALAKKHAEVSVILLDHGAILTEYLGGSEAQKALLGKDFKKFVKIQIDEEVDFKKGDELSTEDVMDPEQIRKRKTIAFSRIGRRE